MEGEKNHKKQSEEQQKENQKKEEEVNTVEKSRHHSGTKSSHCIIGSSPLDVTGDRLGSEGCFTTGGNSGSADTRGCSTVQPLQWQQTVQQIHADPCMHNVLRYVLLL